MACEGAHHLAVLLLPLIYGGLPAVGSAALAPAWASLRQPLRHRRVAPLAAKLQHPSPKPIRRVKANSAARRTKARRPLGRGEGALAAAEVWRRRGEGFLRNFIPALGLFLWVRTCVVEPFFIPSQSMAPTLSPNDQIAVEKFSRLYVRARRRTASAAPNATAAPTAAAASPRHAHTPDRQTNKGRPAHTRGRRFRSGESSSSSAPPPPTLPPRAQRSGQAQSC